MKPKNRNKKFRGVKTFGSKMPEMRISFERQALNITANVLLGRDRVRFIPRAFIRLLKQHFQRSEGSPSVP